MKQTTQDAQKKINELKADLRSNEAELSKLKKKRDSTSALAREALSESTQETYNIAILSVGGIDHMIDIAKFFIGLSSTGTITLMGLEDKVANSNTLLVILLSSLVGSFLLLGVLIYHRYETLTAIQGLYQNRAKLFGQVYAPIENGENERSIK